MSIGFLLGIRSASNKRPKTLPHSNTQDYKRRKEPTRKESLRDQIELWREINPAYSQALQKLLETEK